MRSTASRIIQWRTNICASADRRFSFLCLRCDAKTSGSQSLATFVAGRSCMASQPPPSPTSASDTPRWRREYEAVLQETDRPALFKRVEIAEAALLDRREALINGSDGHAERREIEIALENLRTLKKKV